jgi:MoxR-like ATPase
MFNIHVDYPSLEEEEMILSTTTGDSQAEPEPVLSARAITNMQKLVNSVAISDYMITYVARLVRATRPKDPSAPEFIREYVDWGAGPRAGQFLIRGGKAMAALDGRFSVSLDDIRAVAEPVLRHRLAANFQAQAEGLDSVALIDRLVDHMGEPDIPKYEGRGKDEG